MRYYKGLYIGNNVTKEQLECIKQGKPVFNLYVLCVSSTGKGLFEILSTRELFKPYNASKNYGIIAVMEGSGSIKRALCQIMQNWYRAHNSLEGIREYFNQNSC